MFSPYYALARRRSAEADPTNHCCFNVALYGPHSTRWSMTERGRRALAVTRDTLSIGPSALRWDGSSLRIDFDEIGAPRFRRVRGTVRVWPQALARTSVSLNPEGGHVWEPLAPRARVEVSCSQPDLSWSGDGYLDHNRGDGALEAGFRDWIWSRAPFRDGAVIFYDGVRKNGDRFDLGLLFDRNGDAQEIVPPQTHDVARTGWRMPRPVRSEAPVRLLQTLENAPFYARSAVATRFAGENLTGVHEIVSLDRFRSPIVQAMLPFRMPRRA